MRFSVVAAALAASTVVSATPFVKRDYNTLLTNLTVLNKTVYALDASIRAFPASGGTAAQALQVNNNVTAVDNAIKNSTAAVNTTPSVTVAQAQNVVSIFNNLSPVIIDALTVLDQKKSGFTSVPFGKSLVQSGLAKLSNDTKTFENGLVAKIPTTATLVKSSASSLTSKIDAAFKSASSVYAS